MTEEIIDNIEEIELSVRHIVPRNGPASEEYEIHAGFSDKLVVSKELVERLKTVTGVDIREEEIQCGAEIEVVQVVDDA